MKRTRTAIGSLLLVVLLGTLLIPSLPMASSNDSGSAQVGIITDDMVYVDNSEVYISASPHTVTADGYIYLNVTSKTFGGNIDLCFGFDGKLAYPTRLELYDPKVETTQHALNLSVYWNRPDYRLSLNLTGQEGKTVYGGNVNVENNINYGLSSNQAGTNQSAPAPEPKWINVLNQYFQVGDLDTKMFYWNTTEMVCWRSILEGNGFDNQTFNYQGMDKWFSTNAVLDQGKEYYLRVWLTMVPTLDDVTHEFLVGIKPHDKTFAQAVSDGRLICLDPWYDDAWNYRKSHVIDQTAGAGIGYQVPIRVHRCEGTSSGQDVYVGTNCSADFGDIRFTLYDASWWLLNYSLEGVSGDTATFWVKMEEDLSWGGGRSIYLYYNNSAAQTTGNPQSVFDFYDDFNTYRETWSGGTVANGYLEFSSTVYGTLRSSATQGYVALEGKFCFPESTTVRAGVFGLCKSDNTVIHFARPHKQNTALAFDGDYNSGDPVINNCVWGQTFHDCNLMWGGSSTAAFTGFFDATSANPSIGKSVGGDSIGKVVASVDVSGWIGRVDNVRVRKYVYPEPVQDGWGPQEGNNPPPAQQVPWAPYNWSYRKSHIINCSADAGQDYQVRLRVYYGNPGDSGDVVGCNGLCRTDFGDIRFTGSDGYTPLSYWMESNTSTYAVFWVKVQDDLSSVNRTIYVYYGNSNATSASDEANTFLNGCADDVEPSNSFLDSLSGGWVVSTDYSVSASHCVKFPYSSDGSVASVMRSLAVTYPSSMVAVENRIWLNAAITADHFHTFVFINSANTAYVGPHVAVVSGVLQYFCGGWQSSGWSVPLGQWVYLRLIIKPASNNFDVYSSSDGTSWTLRVSNGAYIGAIGGGSQCFAQAYGAYNPYNYGGSLRYGDNYFWRKYVNPEPAHGTWGPEDHWKAAAPLYASTFNQGYESNYASAEALESIYQLFAAHSNIYAYYPNEYGSGSSKTNEYSKASFYEDNTDYVTVFHYGHFAPIQGLSVLHWGYLGLNNDTDIIKDYELFAYTDSAKHYFVFIWTCALGTDIGSWDPQTGAVGIGYAWTHQSNATLSRDGYGTRWGPGPDNSSYVFIGWNGTSPFLNDTARNQNTYTYKDFLIKFYDYALQGYSINQALNLVSGDFWGVDFAATDLYKGYLGPGMDGNFTEPTMLHVWGNGNNVLPH